MQFIYSVQSEWLKTKGSAASWLCLIGGLFIPVIYFFGFIKDHTSINSIGVDIWQKHFWNLWRYMAGFLLPIGVILASSLITQAEYKNNAWKQLHTTPQSYTTIFLSKLIVIILLTLKFFIFFNAGIILSGIIPCLLFDRQLPKENIPLLYYLTENGNHFLTCLPIIAFQFLMGLRFKNFLIPIGAGLLGVIGTIIANSWKYIYVSPFSYGLSYLKTQKIVIENYVFSIAYFLILVIAGYVIYINQKVKG